MRAVPAGVRGATGSKFDHCRKSVPVCLGPRRDTPAATTYLGTFLSRLGGVGFTFSQFKDNIFGHISS